MISVQQMLMDFLPDHVLERVQAEVQQGIVELQRKQPLAEGAKIGLADYQELAERLQKELNKRRGLDGMTPLTS